MIKIPSKVIEKMFGKSLNGAIINFEDSTLFFKNETIRVKTQEYFSEYFV